MVSTSYYNLHLPPSLCGMIPSSTLPQVLNPRIPDFGFIPKPPNVVLSDSSRYGRTTLALALGIQCPQRISVRNGLDLIDLYGVGFAGVI